MQWKSAIVAGVVAVAVIGVGVWASIPRVAVMLAPQKQAVKERSAAAEQADEMFWRTFHGGDYGNIQPVLDALTAAYLETPNDAKTAGHIAWAHNWRMAERARMDSAPATITDDTMLARRYFAEAAKLDPSDARVRGFLAGHMMIEGNLHKDEKLKREGWFMMQAAIRDWPEFNMFTGGFVVSRLGPEEEQFKQGLEWQWQTLDTCIGGEIDRADPDYSPYMRLETRDGKKRACWNSEIAPHNLEGFFLNMGDMLVKSGDWQTAQKIYANARLPGSYGAWKFQDVLQQRIDNAKENVLAFRAAPGEGTSRMMIDSEFACMACHQE